MIPAGHVRFSVSWADIIRTDRNRPFLYRRCGGHRAVRFRDPDPGVAGHRPLRILNPPTRTDSHTASLVYSGNASASTFISFLSSGRMSSFFRFASGEGIFAGILDFESFFDGRVHQSFEHERGFFVSIRRWYLFFAFLLHLATSFSVISFNGIVRKYGMSLLTASFVRRMVRPRICPFFSLYRLK